MGLENVVKYGALVATLPLPATGELTSGQTAAYYDGSYLHVWFGCHLTGGGQADEDIYYTKAASPFTSWSTPVLVIAGGSNGFRDPVLVVESTTLYIYIQRYTAATSAYDTIVLYKIAKGAAYQTSGNYTSVGTVLTLGTAGAFDDVWVASPVVRKIGSTYCLLYEAKSSLGEYGVGLASSSAIETIPYTRVGQVDDVDGNPIRNPFGAGYYIVPNNFFDDDTVVFHVENNVYPPETTIRYMRGNWTTGVVNQYDDVDLSVVDAYDSHNNVAFAVDSAGAVMNVSNTLYFLEQTWNYGTAPYIRLFSVVDMQNATVIDGEPVLVQAWSETQVPLSSSSDEWENGFCRRKTRVYGASTEYTLTCVEHDVVWEGGLVGRLQWKSRNSTTVFFSSDKPLRRVIREVKVLDCGFDADSDSVSDKNIRVFTVKLREA
jgi:hypothetical protein